jgi:phosphoenolpyruvate synthase/pyruvate phosphate dikinase
MQKVLSSSDAGGKGFNLQVLKLHGFNVPDFAIFSHEDMEKYESRLQDWPFFNCCLNWGPVAVRSSGSLEDGSLSSFAGLFKTKLNVQGTEPLKEAIIEVWLSQNSDLISDYIKKNNIPAENFRFSVVIQKMINPEYAGVSFSANPVNGLRSQCLISFTDGLGEKLVSGDETGSSYVVSLENEILTHQGNLKLPISALNQIAEQTRKAAEIFKTPVDVEWAAIDNQVYILQARPITSPLGHTSSENLTVFDNSNIQESYNGVTTPLTYSYAVEAYHQVYNQIMKLMKMSEEEFEQAQFRHRHMLGLIEGRVYYNINSWYEGLLCLPHFGRQKEAMEKMMGLQKPVDFVRDVTLSKSEKLKRLPSLMLLMIRLLFQFSKIDRHVSHFTHWFNELEVKFDPSKNQFLDNHDLIRRLYDFQRQTLEKWGVPILNDFLVMMTHGSLKKQAEIAGLDAEFHEALQGSDVESVKPSQDLMEIANLMRRSNFWSHISNIKDTTHIQLVLLSQFPVIYGRINKHLNRFGDRSFAELKLETITYRQDQTPLFNLLYELCRVEEKTLSHPSDAEIENRFIEGFKKHFGFIKSLSVRRRLKKLKKAIAARELMRLHRTRVFGMNREYYLEIGRRLTHLKQINEYRDIFYLTRQEIFDYFWGHSVLNDLKGLVSLRKESWKKFQDRQLDQQVLAGVPNGYWSQLIKDKNLVHDLNVAELKGLGCSIGIVRAHVKKVENPYDVSDLQNKILLAERTDPGWTPLFSMIKGAIIERGSALSHSAVIAREMGLPVVVGVDNATELIFDGDEVEIDGQTGTIKILSRGKNGALTT